MRQFPWAYIAPGRGYFTLIAASRCCPEIRWQLHERERLRLKMALKLILWSPILIPLCAFAALTMLFEWLSDWIMDHWESPVAKEMREREMLLHDAHRILTTKQIRDRIDGRDELFF